MKKIESSEDRPGADCPLAEDVAAFAVGERDCIDSKAVANHLRDCATCREMESNLDSTLSLLRAEQAPFPDRDLLPNILERIAGEDRGANIQVSRGWPLSRMMKYAAAIAVFVSTAAAFLIFRADEGPYSAKEDRSFEKAYAGGTAWLLARQAPNGGWSVEDLGGDARYGPALNGLALLALTQGDRAADLHTIDAISSAARYLAGLQSPEGRFGRSFDRTLYNHGIATLALLSAYEITGEDELREPIGNALAYIRAKQSYTGGWGYQGVPATDQNNSVTAWQMQSLMLAQRLGWNENHAAIRRGLAWIAGTIDNRGHFSYRTAGQPATEDSNAVTMMGAYCLLAGQKIEMPISPDLKATVLAGVESLAQSIPEDYYSAFYYSSVIAEIAPESHTPALERIRSSLLARQADGGGWQADDRWSPAGGQIYSTAMSLLALRH